MNVIFNGIKWTFVQAERNLIPHLHANNWSRERLSLAARVGEVAISCLILFISLKYYPSHANYYLISFVAGLVLKDHIRKLVQTITDLFQASIPFKLMLTFMGLISINYMILAFPAFAASYWAWNTNRNRDPNKDPCYFVDLTNREVKHVDADDSDQTLDVSADG